MAEAKTAIKMKKTANGPAGVFLNNHKYVIGEDIKEAAAAGFVKAEAADYLDKDGKVIEQKKAGRPPKGDKTGSDEK